MTYVPDKGDIISLNYDPSAGQEIVKRRPAFVISRKQFNEHTGFAIVAPITSTKKGMKLEVVLPDSITTEGAVLVHQIRSLDFEARQAEFVEPAPKKIVDQVNKIAILIIS